MTKIVELEERIVKLEEWQRRVIELLDAEHTAMRLILSRQRKKGL